MVVDYFEYHLGPTPSGLADPPGGSTLHIGGRLLEGEFFVGEFGEVWLEVLTLTSVNELYCG